MAAVGPDRPADPRLTVPVAHAELFSVGCEHALVTFTSEAGATFQQDFIEIFNAGSSTIDLNGWALVVITNEGTTQYAQGARFTNSFAVPPGMHLLLRFAGNGTNGQTAPGEYPVITETTLGSTGGMVFDAL